MDAGNFHGFSNFQRMLTPVQVFRAQIKNYFKKASMHANYQENFIKEIDSITPEYRYTLVGAYLEQLLTRLFDSFLPADLENLDSLITYCTFNFYNWPSLIARAVDRCNLKIEQICNELFVSKSKSLLVVLAMTLSLIYSGNSEQTSNSIKFLNLLFPLLINLNSKISNTVLSRLAYWTPKLSLDTKTQILILNHLEKLNEGGDACKRTSFLNTTRSLSNQKTMFNFEEFIINELNFPLGLNCQKPSTDAPCTGSVQLGCVEDDLSTLDNTLKQKKLLPLFVSLSNILYDFGYSITHSSEALNHLFLQFQDFIDESSITKVVLMMSQNTEGLRSCSHPVILNGITLNTEFGGKKSWNIENFVSSTQKFKPQFDWLKVLNMLANEEEYNAQNNKLNWNFLQSLYQHASGRGLPVDWALNLCKKNLKHLSLLLSMLYNSDEFDFSGCEPVQFAGISKLLESYSPKHTASKNAPYVKSKVKKKNYDKKEQKIICAFPWMFLDVLKFFLNILEQACYGNQVFEIFKDCMRNFPELLLLNLSECGIRTWHWEKLVVGVVSKLYFNDRVINRQVFEHVWKSKPEIIVMSIKTLYKTASYSKEVIFDVLNERLGIIWDYLIFVIRSDFGISLMEMIDSRGTFELSQWMLAYVRNSELNLRGLLRYLASRRDTEITSKTLKLILRLIYDGIDYVNESVKKEFVELISTKLFAPSTNSDNARSIRYCLNASVKFQENYISTLLDASRNSSEFADELLALLVQEYKFFDNVPISILKSRAILFADMIYFACCTHISTAVHVAYASISRDVDVNSCRIFGIIVAFRIFRRVNECPRSSSSLIDFGFVKSARDVVSVLKIAITFSPLSGNMLKFRCAINDSSMVNIIDVNKQKKEKPKIVAPAVRNTSSSQTAAFETPASNIAQPTCPDYNRRSGMTAFDLINIMPMIVQPTQHVRDRIRYVLNTLSNENITQKIEELKCVLKPQYFDYYSQQLTINRVPNNVGFHALYVELNVGFGNAELLEVVLAWTYFAITSILNLSTTYSRYLIKLLKIFGSWLGMITLAQNKPILHIFLPIKDLLIRSWANCKLKFVMLMTTRIFMCNLGVFAPPNPWTVAILRLYKEFYANFKLPDFLRQDIEELFRYLKLDLETFPASEILQKKLSLMSQAPPPPLFDHSSVQVLYRMRRSLFKNADASQSEIGNADIFKSPSEGVVHQNPFSLSSHTEVPQSTCTRQAALESEPSLKQPSSRFTPPDYFKKFEFVSTGSLPGGVYIPHLLTTPKMDQFFASFPQIKKCLYAAFQNSIDKFLTMVSNRILSFTLATTCSLVLKDFAFESDFDVVLSAARSMIHGLCYSFTSITSWRSLRVSVVFQVAEIFESMDPSQADTLCRAIELNLNQACLIVHNVLLQRALKFIETTLKEKFAQNSNTTQSSSAYQRLQPELLKVRQGIYERFRTLDDIRPELTKIFNQTKVFVEVISRKAAEMDIPFESWSKLDNVLAQLMVMIINKPFVIVNLIAFVLDLLESLCKNHPVVLNVEIWYLLVLSVISRFFGMTKRIWEGVCKLQLHKLPDFLLGLIHWGVIPVHWIDTTLEKQLKTAYLSLIETPQFEDKRQLEKKFIQCSKICAHLIQASLVDTKWLTVSDFPSLISLFKLILIKNADVFSSLKKPIFNLFMEISKLEMKEKRLGISANPKGFKFSHKQAPYMQSGESTLNLFNTDTGSSSQSLKSVDPTVTESDKIPVFHENKSRFPDFVKSFNFQYSTLLNRQKALYSIVPYNLLVWFSSWIELVNSERHDEKMLLFALEHLRAQNLITLQSAEMECSTYRSIIEAAVLSYLLFSHYRSVVGAQLLSRPEVPPTSLIMNLTMKPYAAAEACSFLAVKLLKYHKDPSVLCKFIKQLSLALAEDCAASLVTFNSLPYHWIFSRLVYYRAASGLDFYSIYWITSVTEFLSDCAPTKMPSFAFAWLDLLSSRDLLPHFLQNRQSWPALHHLVQNLLKFLRPYVAYVGHSGPVNLIYEGTMRFFLVLLHDCPEFLITFHYQFCSVLPHYCIQLRNVILSAFPQKMKLTDPTAFTTWGQMNLKEPLLYKDFLAPLVECHYKDAVKAFLTGKDSHDTLLSTLPHLLLTTSEPLHPHADSRYDVSLINSLVLFAGIVPYLVQERLDALVYHLLNVLDDEGCYHVLNSFFNQIRYPNVHTRLFVTYILRYWGETQSRVITRTQHIIARILFERLNVRRPHPWGLIVLARKLSSTKKYGFVNIIEYCRRDQHLSALILHLARLNYLVDIRA